ncbi:MBL fold metallo-hydrolase [Sinorhizobium meliloti]|uniref:MBL fold metallo-hydrolase n=1 Tax=Rhizobium meliloti TaxID=382 RepID=UPI00398CDD9B
MVSDTKFDPDKLKADSARQNFALVRINTTGRRLSEFLGIDTEAIIEGAWVYLEIGSQDDISLRAKIATLGATGYDQVSDVWIRRGEYLFNDGPLDFRPFPGGAGIPDHRAFANDVAQVCRLPSGDEDTLSDLARALAEIGAPAHIKVHDVGQASFIGLNDEGGEAKLYFDAGWPLIFNRRTEPAHFAPRRVDVVILSHWDFDHLLSGYKFPHLRKSCWIVPDQNMGPGARRFAALLEQEGRVVVVNRDLDFGWGSIHQAGGLRNDANNSGLVLTLTLQSGKQALLVGDAHYGSLRLPVPFNPDFLVATHHGGLFEGGVPRPPLKGAPCVVSVGKGNVYGHPKDEAIKAHKDAGWRMHYTTHEGNVGGRGPRQLGP